MSVNIPKFNEEIGKAISNALQKNVEAEFDKKKEEMIKALDLRKDEICAGIMIDLMKTVDIGVFGDHVTITIKKIEDKK